MRTHRGENQSMPIDNRARIHFNVTHAQHNCDETKCMLRPCFISSEDKLYLGKRSSIHVNEQCDNAQVQTAENIECRKGHRRLNWKKLLYSKEQGRDSKIYELTSIFDKLIFFPNFAVHMRHFQDACRRRLRPSVMSLGILCVVMLLLYMPGVSCKGKRLKI